MSTQAAADAASATPPALVGSFVLLGYPIEQWVLLLTALYTVIMIIKNASAACRVLAKGAKVVWQKVQRQKRP